MNVLEIITSVVVLSGIIPVLIFLVRYITHSPFEQFPEGIAIFLQKLAILALFGIIIVGYHTPDLWFRPYLRLAVYSAVIALFWADVVNLLRVQREFPWSRPRERYLSLLKLRTYLKK